MMTFCNCVDFKVKGYLEKLLYALCCWWQLQLLHVLVTMEERSTVPIAAGGKPIDVCNTLINTGVASGRGTLML